jgi:uncharacterized protein YcaQ
LLTPAAYVETGTDPGAVADALAAELWTMAVWLGLDSVFVERRNRFARTLAAAVGSRAG